MVQLKSKNIFENNLNKQPASKNGESFLPAGHYKSNLSIQPKLTIGSPNDHFEQQADVVADQVMRMPLANSIQRKCSSCEHDEEKIQKKPFNISPIMQKSGENTGNIASESVANEIESTRGNGHQMDSGTKSFMESRFGNDFSNVKIHTDSKAIQLSQSLNAQAFTVGKNVFFNEGKYNPNSESGKHLLAHELTHTVQQTGRINRKPNNGMPSRDWNIPITEDDISDPFQKEEYLEYLRNDREQKAWAKVMDRFSKGELHDLDLKNIRLRNRLIGLKTPAINDLITKIKAFQIQRDKDIADPAVKDTDKKQPVSTTKIIEFLEVRKDISTPMPEEASVDSLIAGMIDSFSVTYNDVFIKVMPDKHGQPGDATTPNTNFIGRFSMTTNPNGTIKTLTKDGNPFNPTRLEVTITTSYNSSPNDTSAYGRGTTYNDISEGNTTLRVHEGSHGTDYIDFVKNNPLPTSLKDGVIDKLTPAQFDKILKYSSNISKASCELTDQVGFSQDEFLKTPDGRASGIRSCRLP